MRDGPQRSTATGLLSAARVPRARPRRYGALSPSVSRRGATSRKSRSALESRAPERPTRRPSRVAVGGANCAAKLCRAEERTVQADPFGYAGPRRERSRRLDGRRFAHLECATARSGARIVMRVSLAGAEVAAACQRPRVTPGVEARDAVRARPCPGREGWRVPVERGSPKLAGCRRGRPRLGERDWVGAGGSPLRASWGRRARAVLTERVGLARAHAAPRAACLARARAACLARASSQTKHGRNPRVWPTRRGLEPLRRGEAADAACGLAQRGHRGGAESRSLGHPRCNRGLPRY